MSRMVLLVVLAELLLLGAAGPPRSRAYPELYRASLHGLELRQDSLLQVIGAADLTSARDRDSVVGAIHAARLALKSMDLWLRYFEPVAYDKLNGPLLVEWENEAYEKFVKPYVHEGAGLSLAEQYLEDGGSNRDSLAALVRRSRATLATFAADSITRQLDSDAPFFLANRLFLLNLAAIYTTGFECPEPQRIVVELRAMLESVADIYAAHDRSFPDSPLSPEYHQRFRALLDFVRRQPDDYTAFDHYAFIRDHVNPLFALDQQLIARYRVVSRSVNDYTLSNACPSIFDKSLFFAQDTRGIFTPVDDARALEQLRAAGRLLFYDPILSDNDQRSCASCHHPKQYFTDNDVATPLAFDRRTRLPRNAPSLADVVFNHLIMLDGKHLTLQDQAMGVITNPIEMHETAADAVAKVMSCGEYRDTFRKLLRWTPEEKQVTLEHIASAITYYYSGFSAYASPFDDAMSGRAELAENARRGFNVFMSKAQCGTCHYVPQFNGVRPPYVSSEFEVLGVPGDSLYRALSPDSGRYDVNPAAETMRAFRTVTVRNVDHTGPYMHNGVFRTLDQVIEFYDAGGGAGHGLRVEGQTLPTDSLRLTPAEKADLKAFMSSLDERIAFEQPPARLPVSSRKPLNQRKVGGEY